MLRKLLSPSAAYALKAAEEALRDAGLAGSPLAQCGLFVGSVCLEANPEAFIPALRESISASNEVDLARFATHGMNLLDPLFLVKSLPNAGACAIAIMQQALGCNLNVTNGSVSGLQATIAAAAAIERGETSVAVAGGYDTLLQMDNIVEHLLAKRLALRHSNGKRPRCFSNVHQGYALGEGAAFVVLESADSARRRSATVYGRIAGYGQSCFSQGWGQTTAPADGLAYAARKALASAGGGAPDVVMGDGLGIGDDDSRETAVAKEIALPECPRYTASTGALGFTGAASGVFSLVHALLSIRNSVIPPVIADVQEDALSGGLRLVRDAQPCPVRRVLVWNSDRGIKNAAIVADAWDGS